jgi:hypothetical protein
LLGDDVSGLEIAVHDHFRMRRGNTVELGFSPQFSFGKGRPKPSDRATPSAGEYLDSNAGNSYA